MMTRHPRKKRFGRTTFVAISIIACSIGSGCTGGAPGGGGGGNGGNGDGDSGGQGGGGNNGGDFETFILDTDLQGTGQIAASASEAVSKAGVFTVSLSNGPVSGGTLDLTRFAPIIQPATNGLGKIGFLPLQSTTFEFSGRVAAADEVETVCESGEFYGPFFVVVDEVLNPVSVEPREVDLSCDTLELINSGEFSICVIVNAGGAFDIEIPLIAATLEEGGPDECTPTDEGGSSEACNSACGFDDNAPDGSRAAAICSIIYPEAPFFGGSPTDGRECTTDASCDDGDICTVNECIGAVVFICSSFENMQCDSGDAPQVQNGDIVDFEFDHKALSVTVNGEEAFGDGKLWSWTVQDLSSGSQTLDIQWTNRDGATPATGCYTDAVTVR